MNTIDTEWIRCLAEFDALIQRTGWKTVPQIFIDEKLIGGFQELVKLDREGKLVKI